MLLPDSSSVDPDHVGKTISTSPFFLKDWRKIGGGSSSKSQ